MIKIIGWLIISFLVVQFSLGSLKRVELTSIAVAPPKISLHFNFGFKNIMADSLWVRWLQNFEQCIQVGGAHVGAFADIKKTVDLNKNIGKCESGWGYQMLDRITDLNPDFIMAYRVGILSLSVFAKDRQGGSLLIEKAVKRYPRNWTMAYHGAYHYMFEDINPTRAAELLVVAAKNGAPLWVASLAAKINMEQSKDEFALKYLLEIRDQFPDKKMIDRINERITEIQDRIRAKKK